MAVVFFEVALVGEVVAGDPADGEGEFWGVGSTVLGGLEDADAFHFEDGAIGAISAREAVEVVAAEAGHFESAEAVIGGEVSVELDDIVVVVVESTGGVDDVFDGDFAAEPVAEGDGGVNAAEEVVGGELEVEADAADAAAAEHAAAKSDAGVVGDFVFVEDDGAAAAFVIEDVSLDVHGVGFGAEHVDADGLFRAAGVGGGDFDAGAGVWAEGWGEGGVAGLVEGLDVELDEGVVGLGG